MERSAIRNPIFLESIEETCRDVYAGDGGKPHRLRYADEGGGQPGHEVGGEVRHLRSAGGHTPGGCGIGDIGWPAGGG